MRAGGAQGQQPVFFRFDAVGPGADVVHHVAEVRCADRGTRLRQPAIPRLLQDGIRRGAMAGADRAELRQVAGLVGVVARHARDQAKTSLAGGTGLTVPRQIARIAVEQISAQRDLGAQAEDAGLGELRLHRDGMPHPGVGFRYLPLQSGHGNGAQRQQQRTHHKIQGPFPV